MLFSEVSYPIINTNNPDQNTSDSRIPPDEWPAPGGWASFNATESDPHYPFSRFNINLFSPMMEYFRSDYKPHGGFIAIGIYMESLIALLDEPETSVLARFEYDMDILQNRPIEITLLKLAGEEYPEWFFHLSGLNAMILRDQISALGPVSHSSLIFMFQIPRGGGNHLRTRNATLVTDFDVIEHSSPENVSKFLLENGVDAEILDVHLLLFDDPARRFMPSHFTWVLTDAGVYFIWMVNPRGPHMGRRDDEELIRRLYTAEEFRENWRTLMDRNTMTDNR